MIVIKRPSLFDHWPSTIKSVFFCQQTFQFFRVQTKIKLSAIGYGDTACFFRNNNSMSIRLLRDSHCCAMSQAKFFRYIQIMGYRKNTSCRLDTFFAAGDAEMGAGHKEKITTASDVMSGLRLSLSRRRTIELGLAVGMAFSAPGVRGAEAFSRPKFRPMR